MNTTARHSHNRTEALIRLPAHLDVSSVAAGCRDAWRVFVDQSEGWRFPEYVLWSAALCAPVTYTTIGGTAGLRESDPYHAIDARLLDRLIDLARLKAHQVLTTFAIARNRIDFGVRMHKIGAVTRCEDHRGNRGYVPTPLAGSLTDRVIALIAADLLNRPRDFEGETLCSSCGGVAVGHHPCCARYEGRDTAVPSRYFDHVTHARVAV